MWKASNNTKKVWTLGQGTIKDFKKTGDNPICLRDLSLCSNTSIRLLFFQRDTVRFICLNRTHSFNNKEKSPQGQGRCARPEFSCPQMH